MYLDFAATTPVDKLVAEVIATHLGDDGSFANPSAGHVAGRRAAEDVRRAAEQLASLLHCDSADLVWTSGATESNNLAIIGAARYRAPHGKHLITMPTEHKAVTDVFAALGRLGFEVTWLEPDADGLLDPGQLAAAMRDDTQLVSIMSVNNETGVMQNLAALGDLCRSRDVLFHVDAAQAAGKLLIDLASLPIDLLSLTAHKMYGPKGVGALFIANRPGCHVAPLTFGGGQQGGLRPGTLPVHLIAAFGKAAEIARQRMKDDQAHLTRLRGRLWSGLKDIEGISLNGSFEQSFAGIVNVSIADIDGESLLLALEPLCVATGSACNSTNQEPSYVLRAMGRSDELAQSSIRFSFGRQTSDADIDFAIRRYIDAVTHLRSLAPARTS